MRTNSEQHRAIVTAVSTNPPVSTRRNWLASSLLRLAQIALVLTIITLPWRQRLTLLERPSPPIYSDFTDILLPTQAIFLLLLPLFWGAGRLLKPRRLQTGPFFLWLPLVGMTIAAGVSAVTAGDPLLAGYHAAQLVLLDLLYLYIVNEGMGRGVVATAVSLQILLQSTIAIGQAWQQRDLGLAWLGEQPLGPAGGSAVWAQGGLISLRAYGLADHPNILGASLAFGLLLLTAWYLETNSRWRVLAAALFALGGAALFLTYSRPAWTAFALGMLWVTAVINQKQPHLLRRWLTLTGVALLLLLPIVRLNLPYLRLGTDADVIAARVAERQYAQVERADLNQAVNRLFVKQAITGVGIGNLPLALRRAQPDFDHDYQAARISLLTAAAETGLLGALFYFIALIAPWLALALRRNRLAFSPTFISLSGALLTVAVFGFYDAYPWFYPAGRLWQWLVWGMWARRMKDENYRVHFK